MKSDRNHFKYRRVSVPALLGANLEHHLSYYHPSQPNFLAKTSPITEESSNTTEQQSTWTRTYSKNNNNSSTLRKISATTQRKFSTVTDAVSRKLSTTIWGLAGGAVTGSGYYGSNTGTGAQQLEIANQGKSLASQYIRSRLKRSGFFHMRKLVGLQRLRSLANIPGGLMICEVSSGSFIRIQILKYLFKVFHELLLIGQELERMHPKLYSSVCRQVSVTVTSDKVLRNVLIAIAGELFKTDITWGKVVSLYAVSILLTILD
jgi:hypothetical protein